MAGTDKFEANDLPLILAALHEARESKENARLTIDFAANSGVVAILLEKKKKIKG